MVKFPNYNNTTTFDKITFEMDEWDTNSSTPKSSLSILSSRPSMGKTSFAIQLACSMNSNESILYVSNESIINKTLAHLTGISVNKINADNLSIEEKNAVIKAFQKRNTLSFIALENILLTQKDSLQAIRQAIDLHQPKGVIIDGISWRDFQNSQYTQNDYIDYFKELKSLSDEYKIDMLVLHELDRTVEKKDKNSLPDLSDLKNENFLTTITDNIFFLYRPTYYGLNDYHSQFKGKHIMEVICFEKEKKEINFFEINANFNQFTSLDPDSTSIM